MANLPSGFNEPPSFEDVLNDSIKLSKVEVLLKSVELHSFTHADGKRYIDVEDLLNMANDIEAGL